MWHVPPHFLCYNKPCRSCPDLEDAAVGILLHAQAHYRRPVTCYVRNHLQEDFYHGKDGTAL